MPKPLPYAVPTFDDFDEERQYLKQRLAAAFRLFSKFGFSEGVAGHITARDPEFPDRFWVNPFAIDFGLIKASDIICVDPDGEVVIGEYPVNTAAFAIHSQVHAARPDVKAAAHAHSINGKAFSSLGKLPMKELKAGSYAFIPKGRTMFGWTPEAAIVQVHGIGPFHIHWRDGANWRETLKTLDDADAASIFKFKRGQRVVAARGTGRIRQGYDSGEMIG